MLLLVEHDTIMSTPEARQCLADFVAARPAVNVAIFHSSKLKSNEVCADYPAALRKRLIMTPRTPRKGNLGYCLTYEICCVTSALKFVSKMGKDDSWLCVVPPEWDYPLTHQFGNESVVVIDGTFAPADAELLAERLARQRQKIGQKIMALETKAYELAGQPFNLASPRQLAEILFDKLGLPVKKKTPSGGPSTDEEALTELALNYPLPKLLLEHRSLRASM